MQEEICENPSLLDREKLREERRARNKLKREHRKEEKRRKNVEGDSDKINKGNKGVAIVSRDFLEGFKRQLEQPKVNRIERKHPIVLNIDIERKRKENETSESVNEKSEIKCGDKNNKEKHDQKTIGGNRLDSSQPTRHAGKYRESEKPKKLSRLKKELVTNNENPTDLSEIDPFDYCKNLITENLETYCEVFIKRIVELQEKLYKRDTLKGDYKRRYFVGFHEVKKYLAANKIKILIIAKDLKILAENDPLHSTVKVITDLADNFQTPYIFALKRRKIGALTLKFLPISCIGVRDYDGANGEFKNIIEELATLKYQPSEFATTSSENVNQPLLQKLKEELVIK